MKKLAMFGGTFNPIHNGHLHMVQGFRERLGLDRVLLIPSRVPPHKAADDLADAKDRLEMCRLAAEPCGLAVSDLELRRDGPSYTVDTLRQLHKANPDAELYLLMGADMFLTLEHWFKSEELLRLARMCAVPREESSKSELLAYAKHLNSMGARTHVEDLPLLPVSSTLVRERIVQGLSIAGLVPEAVEEYIIRHHLYGGISNG
ncbi:nicotinate-nucleotide adenylyltransferase [Faecalispora anaeroviscerum]|uniref:nicotinate-nucleotide adenylyltransferase n=1 Tax=Faecalispora anaeroviscerum TaxID=2991836 RepID=UPI0024B961DC|nr:nicotinate-nucleotide adenylyltransferase [Faecalispora anaeroviscerum]